MNRKPAREKMCEICSTPFIPRGIGQKACSPGCALQWADKQRWKKRQAETRKMRTALNQQSRKWWAKKAQATCNAYIRRRDAGKPCISCGTTLTGKFDAGHYRATGSHPELRFDEDNIHGQCVHCNQHLSGNLIEYRKGLISRVGLATVENLEGPHPIQQMTIDDLKEICEKYKAKGKI